MNRFIGAFAVLISLSLLGACSETGKPPAPTPAVPSARILLPLTEEIRFPDISDSTEVYVGVNVPEGRSPSDISQVMFLFTRRNKSAPDSVLPPPRDDRPIDLAVAATPVDTSQVPDSVMAYITPHFQEPGWTLYRKWWFTGPKYPFPFGRPLNSGEFVQLFAMVTDKDGAQCRSNLVKVRILNRGEDLRPPVAGFTVTPPTGTIDSTFVFDPSSTVDPIPTVTNDEISVRWDFDGDGVWDIDWDKGAHADQKQTKKYDFPRAYRVKMEAKNAYLPDSVGRFERAIQVEGRGGRPNPPNPDDFVALGESPGSPVFHAGVDTFRIGALTYIFNDTLRQANFNEGPVHKIVLTQNFKISKYEVTNALYLRYLREALARDPSPIVHDVGSNTIRYRDRNATDEDTSWVYIKLDPNLTKIYFDLDHNEMRVEERFENHPVTGVSWRGAYAYCVFYGLRLPGEAEWEVAARGAKSTWAYPFSEQLTKADGPKRANYEGWYSGSDPFLAKTTPVGYFTELVDQGGGVLTDSRSVFGLYDMAGNVAEWVNDWYESYTSATESDPQGPITGDRKVTRGGSYEQTRESIRCTQRNGERELETGFASVGFRPAYSIY